jgi:hypothetical protein
MLRTKFARAVSRLAIVLALLGTSFMPRAILCIGPGGHGAIEIVDATGFCPASLDRAQLHRHTGDRVCPAGCVDAPIGASFLASKGLPEAVSLLLAVDVPPAPSSSPERPHRATASPSRQIVRDFSDLRTVVIRC